MAIETQISMMLINAILILLQYSHWSRKWEAPVTVLTIKKQANKQKAMKK